MAVVFNHDVANLVKRIRSYREQLVRSVSAGLQEVSSSDALRMVSFLDAADAFKKWADGQSPALDLPVSSPMTIDVPDAVLDDVINHDLDVVLDLLAILEIELLGGASAKRSSGLVVHDSKRYDDIMLKIRDFIASYLAQINPLDISEPSA